MDGVRNDRRRPDSADLVMAGWGRLLIVAVISLPGFLSHDGPRTASRGGPGGAVGA